MSLGMSPHNAPHNSPHSSPHNPLKQHRCNEILIFCIYVISNVTSQFTSQRTSQGIKTHPTTHRRIHLFSSGVMKYLDFAFMS